MLFLNLRRKESTAKISRSGSGGVINMKTQFITGSITYAIRGRDLLRRHGFKARMEKTPNHLDRVGCGYSIIVEGDADKAEEVLRNARVKILGKIKLN